MVKRMQNTNDGGPAFPSAISRYDQYGNLCVYSEGGMSLRDYFAAKALAGICACGDDRVETDTDQVDFVAMRAYHYADAMLRAREAK